MRNRLNLNCWLGMALVTLVAFGCAKKPMPEAAPPAAAPVAVVAPSTTQTTPTTQMPAQEINTVSSQAVSDQSAADQAAAANNGSSPGLKTIFFDYNQYLLTPAAREALAANSAFLKTNPGLQVRIEGYCDERGSDEYNLALGERRALATQKYLASLGVPKEQLTTISYGEEMPLDPGHTEEAWAKNRRAQFKVVR